MDHSLARAVGDGPRMSHQSIGVGRPVGFHAIREVGHGDGFDADATYPELLTLDRSCAGAAERIEDGMSGAQTEAVEVLADQVRWEGEHEVIPTMDRPVLRLEVVEPTGQFGDFLKGQSDSQWAYRPLPSVATIRWYCSAPTRAASNRRLVTFRLWVG
jgi:hypothetical protein